MLLPVGPGFRLLVGRDIRELTAIRQVLRRASFYGITLTLGARADRRRAARRERGAAARGDQPHDAPDHGRRLEPARAAHEAATTSTTSSRRTSTRCSIRSRTCSRACATSATASRTTCAGRSRGCAIGSRPSPRPRARAARTSPTASRSSTRCSRRSTRCCASRASSRARIAARSRPSISQPIVRDVCELYQAAAEERQVTLAAPRRANRVEVFGDRELLAQVLTNLVDNAVKYTPRRRHGAHRARAQRRHGAAPRRGLAAPAFRPRIASRVLQRFTRLDRARSQPGNGLGLALVNAVTLQHHGRLTLGDNAPGPRRDRRAAGADAAARTEFGRGATPDAAAREVLQIVERQRHRRAAPGARELLLHEQRLAGAPLRQQRLPQAVAASGRRAGASRALRGTRASASAGRPAASSAAPRLWRTGVEPRRRLVVLQRRLERHGAAPGGDRRCARRRARPRAAPRASRRPAPAGRRLCC